MPAPGDQHKPNGVTTSNPFEETKPHINEYTAQEIATLQSRLNKRLGPEFLSTRPGPGNQKIPYLSAEKAINLANEVFGFNGWSTSIQNIQIDFVDESSQTGKVSIGLSVVVRVTLKDGTYHEDIGYGGIENCKGKAMAFEKSKKEATTDALKRALRNFGNVLGNCVYDREYVTKVSKIKAGNGRFDISELHRHPDYLPKPEDIKPIAQAPTAIVDTPSLAFEDSFDVSEFDFDFNENDLRHSEEVLLPVDTRMNSIQNVPRPGMSSMNTPSKAPQPRPLNAQTAGPPKALGQYPGSINGVGDTSAARSLPAPIRPPQTAGVETQRGTERDLSSPGVPSDHFGPQQVQNQGFAPTGPPMGRPAGFYSAKNAANVDQNNISNLPADAVRFNPHAESPSIRKTVGVDHTKSIPVRRELQKAEASGPPNIADPRGDATRRIGMPGPTAPGAMARPGMSTSAYRPPTRNGSPAVPNTNTASMVPPNVGDRILTAAKRPPLGDVSNIQHNVTATTNDGVEAKRQKVGDGVGGTEHASNLNGVTGV